MVKFPRAKIETFAFIFIFLTRFDVPAWLMLVYWFGTQLLSGVGSIGQTTANQGGTAFFAHIGGFVAGVVLIHLMRPHEPHWHRRDLTW
jgi:membrane associated rhomboid family serine protease